MLSAKDQTAEATLAPEKGSARALFFVALLCAGAATALVVDTLCLVILLFQPLFFGDAWNAVDHYRLFVNGEYELSYLFSQHNEHRIVFPRLIFLIDFLLFRGRNVFNITLIFFIQIFHTILFWNICLYLKNSSISISVFLISSVVILLFSLGQHENFYWGFQVAFVGVYVAGTLAFWWLAQAIERQKKGAPSLYFFIGAFAMSIIATYTMSNGVVVPFIMVIIIALTRTNLYMTVISAVIAVSLSLFYFNNFQFVEIHSPPGFILQQPLEFISYVLVYLGAPLGSLGYGAAGVLGAMGLSLSSFAIVRMAIGGEQSAARATLVGVMIFIVATAISTAFGRASFGLEQALSSRYFTPSGVFWSAQIIYWSSLAELSPRQRPSLVAFTVVSLVVVAGAVNTHLQVRLHQKRQFHDLNQASDALLSGVDVPDGSELIFIDPNALAPLTSFLDQQHLSIFSWPEARMRGMRLSEAFDKINDQACVGGFDEAKITPDGVGVAALGWAWDQATESKVERVILVDSQDMIVGFASGDWDRPDVRRRWPQVRRKDVGWKGFAKPSDSSSIRAYAYLDHGHTACLLGARASPLVASRTN